MCIASLSSLSAQAINAEAKMSDSDFNISNNIGNDICIIEETRGPIRNELPTSRPSRTATFGEFVTIHFLQSVNSISISIIKDGNTLDTYAITDVDTDEEIVFNLEELDKGTYTIVVKSEGEIIAQRAINIQ